MRINPVPKAGELLDIAFKRASKEMLPNIRKSKRKELKPFVAGKISIAANILDDRLQAVIKQFPDLEKSNDFLNEMISTVVDLNELRRALGHLQSKKKLLKMVLRKSIGAIHKSSNEREISKAEKAFFGRTSSLIRELESDLLLLEKVRREITAFPEIDAEAPTVIITGFPNVGKTTILKRLTGSAPAIAPYPFTTKGLQLGFFEERYLRYQVIDTPGLLDRKMSERNPIEKRAISTLKHIAGIIVFVVDPTETSGFSLQEQKRLLQDIEREFEKKVIVVLNKSDLASAEQLEEARKEFCAEAISCGEGKECDLRKQIVSESKELFK